MPAGPPVTAYAGELLEVAKRSMVQARDAFKSSLAATADQAGPSLSLRGGEHMLQGARMMRIAVPDAAATIEPIRLSAARVIGDGSRAHTSQALDDTVRAIDLIDALRPRPILSVS